ncbi:MAG TPA: HAD-IIIA family hydrolase [Bacteroidia bacterium]|jgi:3-deoxy-D-manno-octulosonate 8-phosphate phosphatase (KDO 8-P phosphatase)
MENFKTKLSRVKVFIFDVDGVLTNGSVTLMPDGEQVRIMNIKDGYALQLAVKRGYKVAIISGGKSEMVRKRLNGLGITDIYLGSHTKIDTYNDFIASNDINPEEILYMGDDLPDYEVMQRIGVPTCPNDSAPEIKNISIYVSDKKGGEGAVRDVIEQVMRAQGNWFSTEGFVW